MSGAIVVVGAGIAGLAAGYQLKKAGLAPMILEAGSFVGGRMSSERVDGFIIDRGAYTIPEAHRNLTRGLTEMGLGDSLELTEGSASTFYQGMEYGIKIGSPLDFFRYKLLSFKNKLDMIRMFTRAWSLGKALDLKNPTERTYRLERESAAEYLLANYDEQILEKIAYPIFTEIYLGLPENNSSLALLSTIKNLTWFKIFCLSGGMGAMPEMLARDQDIRLECPVDKIIPLDHGDGFEVVVGGDKPGVIRARAVIMTAPLPLAGSLIQGLPDRLIEGIDQVKYAPSVVAALALDRELENVSMINNLLRSDFSTLATFVCDRHKSRRRVPPGKSLLTAILTEPAGRALFNESDSRITDLVLKEMETLFPGLAGDLVFSRIYRWPFGAVQIRPGYIKQRQEMLKDLARVPGNLFFAGDGLGKSSLEISYNNGIAAANSVIKRMGQKI